MFKINTHVPLGTLNQYIAAMNKSRYAGAGFKKKNTGIVSMVTRSAMNINCDHAELYDQRCHFVITYYCKDKRTDKDNTAFAKKFIFDGMVQSGLIKNDGWQNVDGWTELFKIDKINPRVEICVIPLQLEVA